MKEEFKGLNLVELLDLLEPLPELEPVSLWPQTQAWIWIGLLVAAALVLLARSGVRRWQANAYRRAALGEIEAAEPDTLKLAEILRRTAMVTFGRKRVAQLHGIAWCQFLDRTYGGTEFSEGIGKVLASAAYLPNPPNDDLAPLARKWVRQHNGGDE